MSGHTQDGTTSSMYSDSLTINGSPQASKFRDDASSEEFPLTIPSRETHPARTLVLCFDGTGDQWVANNSNIVELFTMLRKDDRNKQMVYYQAGIGTYTSPNIATPFAAKLSKTLDEAVAWNLSAHVMDGYEFLMQNYQAGDRICIFGFSRGAYTARGLAGMIHKVGLLPACNHQQVPFAYKMFTRVDELGWKQSNAFKKAFSVDVTIEFIGVWDTVNSVGLIPRRLPFTTSNTIVKTFRHAVALDERRAKFKANLWNRPSAKEAKLGIKGQQPDVTDDANGESSPKQNSNKKPKKPKKTGTLKAMERQFSDQAERPTDIEEVWFSGCHCDVGGGSVDNGTPHSLARIALRWMIRECFKTDTGILFSSEAIKSSGLDPTMLYPTVQPRPAPLSAVGRQIQKIPSKAEVQAMLKAAEEANSLITVNSKSEEEHELFDSLSPIYDQLSLAWFWWVLELLPMKQHYQKSDNTWGTYMGSNLGNGRFIPKQKKKIVKIHRSVKMRMDAELPNGNGKKYIPAASFQRALDLGNVEWVD
ncbi:hypothetical protein BDZ94DRAFT_1290707 [Collybia nuda]|uniref:T6SS Phospholipase effector Tle1-like catalytic domain-containing protein n=1 Tax=Collybia nuda TaxID=64659 RepID=A0A9P5Y5G4_9AGAR|nr:hypothetical protein BDZ94DRAFT_1290707 [Collybia nuda]